MSRYSKNYTENGYLMNYETPKLTAPQKRMVLQFRVALEDIEPVVWRRIQISPDSNFWDLHVAIQDAMGWKDYHLHHFDIKGRRKRNTARIGIPDMDGFGGLEEVFPGWEIPVMDHFNDLGVTARYLYDYGDMWFHRVILEGYIARADLEQFPLCIGGEMTCPPEDCGGVDGYARLLRELSDPDDPEHESSWVWVGRDWNPNSFKAENVEFCDPYVRWFNAFLLP